MSDLSATQCACGGCSCGGRNGLSCGGSCGCNSCTLIIILLLCCGGCGGDGFGLNSGCGNDNSCIWIILLLFCCGGCGNNNGCGCGGCGGNDCGCSGFTIIHKRDIGQKGCPVSTESGQQKQFCWYFFY